MRSPEIHDGDRAAFYRASLAALRYCDAREARSRRFGPDADSAWLSFAGDMGASERIDLLLRDADVQWPQAFAPRLVFGLAGLADDEPFGAAWASLEPALAEELWQTISSALPSKDVAELTDMAARAWGHALVPVPVPELTPTTRLIVAGASAIAAVARAFAQKPTLAWSDQVLVVAGRPFERQLAALTAPILGSNHPTNVVRPDERPARSFGRARLVVSNDADPKARAWADQLQKED
jgi:hypothetical protein